MMCENEYYYEEYDEVGGFEFEYDESLEEDKKIKKEIEEENERIEEMEFEEKMHLKFKYMLNIFGMG